MALIYSIAATLSILYTVFITLWWIYGFKSILNCPLFYINYVRKRIVNNKLFGYISCSFYYLPLKLRFTHLTQASCIFLRLRKTKFRRGLREPKQTRPLGQWPEYLFYPEAMRLPHITYRVTQSCNKHAIRTRVVLLDRQVRCCRMWKVGQTDSRTLVLRGG